jgi:hypothetical protein
MIRKYYLVCLLFLTACQAGGSPAERSVQNYLKALADKDQAAIATGICPDFEMDALLELDALALVQTTLEDVSCRQVSVDEQGARVVCTGNILTSYNGEAQSIDLSTRTYTVINDNGSWLVCGYKE